MESLAPLLTTYAYNILGTLDDAKDVVQDAFLKYQLVKREDIRDEKAYLVRTVINLSINLKKKIQRMKAAYHGEWLPEPVSTDFQNPAIERRELLSYSLMVLLENLNPKQRAVFILKEAFDYEHEEIAEVLGMSAENSRQLLNRAKKQLQKVSPEDDSRIDRDSVARYLEIIQRGDTDRLESLLNEEILVISDGGGKATAFVNPIAGRKNVLALLAGIHRKYYPETRIDITEINNQPALIYYQEGRIVTCHIPIFDGDQLVNIFFMRNPDKLKSLHGTL